MIHCCDKLNVNRLIQSILYERVLESMDFVGGGFFYIFFINNILWFDDLRAE